MLITTLAQASTTAPSASGPLFKAPVNDGRMVREGWLGDGTQEGRKEGDVSSESTRTVLETILRKNINFSEFPGVFYRFHAVLVRVLPLPHTHNPSPLPPPP